MKRFMRQPAAWIALLVAVLLAVLVAAPAFSSLSWDGFFTNCLVKGVLRLNGKVQPRVVTLTPVAGTGFTISQTQDGVIYEVNPGHATIKGETDKCAIGIAGTGVTVWIVEPNDADRDNEIFGVRNAGGTTPFVLQHDSSQPLHSASGTTIAGGEDLNDVIWYQRMYDSGVSGAIIAEYEAD